MRNTQHYVNSADKCAAIAHTRYTVNVRTSGEQKTDKTPKNNPYRKLASGLFSLAS